MKHQSGHTHSINIQRQRDKRQAVNNELLGIQKKSLEVSNPGDKQEQEADEIARKVVSGGTATVSENNSGINRKGDGNVETSPEFSTKLSGSKGGGQSLDDSTRGEMESKMGADFRGVKIHTGSEANNMSESINAKAFTHGQDVYFKQDQFNTNSKDGKELLAHELVHTVQQSDSSTLQRKEGPTITITIEAGQTLSSIAREYHTTVAELKRLNNLTSDTIYAGKTLKVPAPKKEADDIYGNMQRPDFGDTSITKADLEKNILYKDPVSGKTYTCQAKDTFYGIWVSYQIEDAYNMAHDTGKDRYGRPKAFAKMIMVPVGHTLFYDAKEWSALTIEQKVRSYDHAPGIDLEPDLASKRYPRLNAEKARRILVHRMDTSTSTLDMDTVTVKSAPSKIYSLKHDMFLKDTEFGKWFMALPETESDFNYHPIPPGSLKHLGDNDEAVTKWNNFTYQEKADTYREYK